MKRTGIYALFIEMDSDKSIRVGALGLIDLPKGTYCYIGSAMNGLDSRILRHLTTEKKIHWHIDHLTTSADKMEAYYRLDGEECALRRTAEECGMTPIVRGFGCSDCRCDTHLLSSDDEARDVFIKTAGLLRYTR